MLDFAEIICNTSVAKYSIIKAGHELPNEIENTMPKRPVTNFDQLQPLTNLEISS